MQAFIESLESRQLFSVAGHIVSPERPPVSAIHATVKQTAPLMFAGTALDAKQQTSELLMTVTKTPTGYVAQVRIISSDGKTAAFTLKGDSTGALTFTGRVFGDTATVHAQVSADNTSITGTFSTVRPDGTMNAGTFSLGRTMLPSMNFAGTGTGKDGKVGHITAAVTTTLAGYVAFVRCVNPDGTVGSVVMTADASGHFVYDAADNGEQLHIDMQLSTDGKTITGSFTSTKADNSTSGATFNLRRA
jgi:hypothetical protein